VFIGFTGTPLLKQDKATSLEVFGGYIHTYKFSEAVEDEVVLDLVYEARDIDQRSAHRKKIDAWFDAKTKGAERLAEGRTARAVGHDAERAQLALAHGARGGRTSSSISASSRACPASAATPSWWRPASTRPASISSCSRRRRSRAAARW
jgi:hypothetical protein